MQDLWIVRHSIAGHDAPSDAERRLTHAGTQRAMRLADALRAAGVRFEALLHSPWQRAVETALLLEPLASARIETELLAASPGPRLLDEVRAAGTQVAVVGHMPWVAELASLLLLVLPEERPSPWASFWFQGSAPAGRPSVERPHSPRKKPERGSLPTKKAFCKTWALS